jgi:Domain of unknown function (DUF222)
MRQRRALSRAFWTSQRGWRAVHPDGRIKHVFEGASDAELLAAMGEAQQAERAAFARQLLAVGEFTVRRMDQVYAEHEFWCVDDWEAIAAEIGAELGISRGRASS